MKSKIRKLLLAIVFALLLVYPLSGKAYAAAPTDVINNYVITVTMNEDATVNILYHVEWEVLDSDSLGPLEWVKMAAPNNHIVDYYANSDTIKSISKMDGSYFRIDLDRAYYEGETVEFDFGFVQDYMYQVDKLENGYTVVSFTPEWFEDIEVKHLLVLWDNTNMYSWSPECEVSGTANIWETSLNKGEKYSISVSYPNDAYSFDLTKFEDYGDSGYHEESTFEKILSGFFGIICTILGMGVPIAIWIAIANGIKSFTSGAGFGTGKEKKVTMTKIIYHTTCPSCGAVRANEEKFCTYCGNSLVKSEEIMTEEEINKDKDIRKLSGNGEYRTSIPNTFVRVHTVYVPRPRTTTSSAGRSSGSTRSSCAHSSCAHSSCACACACACAGGGRAGCTNKDFYNTNLKLKFLEKKNRLKK